MSPEARALARLYDRQAHVEDGYSVFATTLQDFWTEGDPRRVADLYKMR